ncbi:MAG: hypothetical protein F9K32_12230 [Desulfobulbaceae bacterium]|nr:MAG: hypothetical protein F9K32_12230 [Desulfobulbaceae bacterium]
MNCNQFFPRHSVCLAVILIPVLLSGCNSYNIQQTYSDYPADKQISISILQCYYEGNDRTSKQLQNGCNDFLHSLSQELSASTHFRITNPSERNIAYYTGNMYDEFHNQKSSIIEKLNENKDIDYALYGITEVGPVGRKDKLCLNFINLKDTTEKSFCTQSEYLITGSGSSYKLDSAKLSTVSSFLKNKAMTGMEDQFKSILKK